MVNMVNCRKWNGDCRFKNKKSFKVVGNINDLQCQNENDDWWGTTVIAIKHTETFLNTKKCIIMSDWTGCREMYNDEWLNRMSGNAPLYYLYWDTVSCRKAFKTVLFLHKIHSLILFNRVFIHSKKYSRMNKNFKFHGYI